MKTCLIPSKKKGYKYNLQCVLHLFFLYIAAQKHIKMASYILTLHDGQNDMEELFKPPKCFSCPVCLGIFNQPVMLWCSHTVCYSCIDRVTEVAEGSEKDTACPVCRKTFPRCDISSLPLNRSLIDAYSEWEVDMKLKRKAFILAQLTKCGVHPEELANLYCADCKRTGCLECCGKCSAENHDIRDARQNLEQEAFKMNMGWDVWCKNQELIESIKMMGIRERDVEKNYHDFFASIDKLEADMTRLIGTKCTQIRELGEEKWKIFNPECINNRKKCTDMLRKVSTYFETVKDMNVENNEQIIGQLQKDIIEKLKECINQNEISSSEVLQKSNDYANICQETMRRVSVNLYTLISHASDVVNALLRNIDDPEGDEEARSTLGQALHTFYDDGSRNSTTHELMNFLAARRFIDDENMFRGHRRGLTNRLNSAPNRLAHMVVPTRSSNTTTRGSPASQASRDGARTARLFQQHPAVVDARQEMRSFRLPDSDGMDMSRMRPSLSPSAMSLRAGEIDSHDGMQDLQGLGLDMFGSSRPTSVRNNVSESSSRSTISPPIPPSWDMTGPQSSVRGYRIVLYASLISHYWVL